MPNIILCEKKDNSRFLNKHFESCCLFSVSSHAARSYIPCTISLKVAVLFRTAFHD